MQFLSRVRNKVKTFVWNLRFGAGVDIVVKYKYKDDSVVVWLRNTFEDRGVKTLELFFESFEKVKKSIHKNCVFRFCCEDYYVGGAPKMFVYASSDHKNLIAIPDFSFINWKECGIGNYDEFCEEIIECSKQAPIYNKLFWIGNEETHPTRKTLCELSNVDNRIEAIGMSWSKNSEGKNRASRYVSLPEHTQYKYLIDVQGRGWSARVKFLLFTGRPLFLVERQWKEYYYKDLKPYVHYIPVMEDLSNLINQLEWAENHERECLDIARNAQEYALNNLRRQNAVEYFEKAILEYIK